VKSTTAPVQAAAVALSPEDVRRHRDGITDLELQIELDRWVRAGALPRVTPATVYVLALPASLTSFVADKVGGADYLAYHNHVHLGQAATAHYVVLPWDNDASRRTASLHTALERAIVNPEGNAWY